MSRVAASVAALTSLALVAVDIVFLSSYFGWFIELAFAVLPISLVGAILTVRVPRNPVGWLLGLSGVTFQMLLFSSAYAWEALVVRPGMLQGGEYAALIANRSFPLALGAIVIMLLYFPSGRGLGGGWTWVERVLILIVALGTLGSTFGGEPTAVLGGPMDLDTSAVGPIVPNPLYQHGLLGDLADLASHLTDSWTIVIILAGPLSLFVRYRRGSSIERAQIRWLAYVATFSIALFIGSNLLTGRQSNVLWALGISCMGLLPIAIGFAVLRYRLYDIDVLIRRTLVYAVLSATLLAAYVGAVTLLGSLLAPFTAGSGVSVAISTLVVVGLFQPVRQRIQRAVDRRFYRARYDAERTLGAFAERLRDEVDLTALEHELIEIAHDTLRPASATVWLRRSAR